MFYSMGSSSVKSFDYESEGSSLLEDRQYPYKSATISSAATHVPWYLTKTHLAFLYCANGALVVMVCLLYFRRRENVIQEQYTPLWDLVEYAPKVFLDNIHEVSPYQGVPDDTKDDLWDRLYRNTSSTIISASRAKHLPNSTMVVPGTDGDGVISLEVFHQLHCLNALRKSLYPQRFPDYSVFFPNGTRNPELSIHHDHCIDRLRQATLCASDLGATYWRWNERLERWGINMRTTHVCRNFETIRRWAVDRNLPDWDATVRSRLTDEPI